MAERDAARARGIVDYLMMLNVRPLEELERLLLKNQNEPPAGEGDGSFSPESWERLRRCVDGLRAFVDNGGRQR